MARKKKRRSHESSLKTRIKRSGKRLVHGYELVALKKRKKKSRRKGSGHETKKTRAKFIGFGY